MPGTVTYAGRHDIRRRARPTAMHPARKAVTSVPLVPSNGAEYAASGAASAATTAAATESGSAETAAGVLLAASALVAVVSAARRLAVASFRGVWPGCSLDCVLHELWPNDSLASFPSELPARVPKRCALLLLRGSAPGAAVPEGALKGATKGATKSATKGAPPVPLPPASSMRGAGVGRAPRRGEICGARAAIAWLGGTPAAPNARGCAKLLATILPCPAVLRWAWRRPRARRT